MVTDLSSTFDAGSSIRVVGYDMSRAAAEQAYEQAGVDASEVDVCELHDCFSANELITYEALGFAAEGKGHELVAAEATTYGGSGPLVNPSGGLISKGHPLGATGLAQCAELTWQLRGDAGARQLEGAAGRPAAQHRARRRSGRRGLQASRLGVELRLRPLRARDEREARAAQEELAPDGFTFLLGMEPADVVGGLPRETRARPARPRHPPRPGFASTFPGR